jgi:hydrogenase maturation factor
MNVAARDLKMAIIGGHCEVTPGLSNPIVIGCALGITNKGRYVTAGGAKPGDKLILTKSAGIEGTAILATERYNLLLKMGLSDKLLKSAQRFFEKISVVKDGIIAFKTGGVDAMHDPTEGGVIGGIHEMADASNLGVKVFEKKIPVAEETVEICKFFKINPLQLISSGAMFIAAKPEFAEDIITKLRREKIEASVIGEFLKNPKMRTIVHKDKREKILPRPECDHLWLALKKHN